MKARRWGFHGWLLLKKEKKKKKEGQSSHNFSLLSFAGFNAIFHMKLRLVSSRLKRTRNTA